MEDISCYICDKVLENNDKVIVLGDIPCWDDEKHKFFCCQQHADIYLWQLARQNIHRINKNEIFWDTTVNDLIDDYYEYEYEKDSED